MHRTLMISILVNRSPGLMMDRQRNEQSELQHRAYPGERARVKGCTALPSSRSSDLQPHSFINNYSKSAMC